MIPLVGAVHAQNPSSRKQKQIAKKAAAKEAETLKQYQKAIKQHNKNQTKDTRKRMRQTRKKMREADPNHKDFFLKKWFEHLKKKK